MSTQSSGYATPWLHYAVSPAMIRGPRGMFFLCELSCIAYFVLSRIVIGMADSD